MITDLLCAKGCSAMDTLTVQELQTKDEVLSAFSVMKQLRTHLDEKAYLDLVVDAQEHDRYKMAALLRGMDIVAVVGFKPMTTLYYGRFVWICDLVTDEGERSKGYGEKLLAYVHNWARANGFGSVALSSGLQRAAAHRFYEEKMGYEKASYVFKASLS